MKKLLILSAMILFFVSCGNKKTQKDEQTSTKTEVKSDSHTSQNSLDYAGIYEGMIPCADCEGIEVVITIDNQGNYTKKMVYLGKEPNNVFTSKGKFIWNDEGNKITFDSEDGVEMYLVGENRLFMLDQDGNRIPGEHADMYIIEQVEKVILK
ncbi:MAG: copper resistance protein NlpE [Bacteroidales bacterium]|jgi:uncharacterized lipoprotein NlpE involved in copper resistance|nr:copper resistance protein NlpE [Bacteroidales bacterium]